MKNEELDLDSLSKKELQDLSMSIRECIDKIDREPLDQILSNPQFNVFKKRAEKLKY